MGWAEVLNRPCAKEIVFLPLLGTNGVMPDLEEPKDRPPRPSGWVVALRIFVGVIVAILLLVGVCFAAVLFSGKFGGFLA
jgi:hypothetical protein